MSLLLLVRWKAKVDDGDRVPVVVVVVVVVATATLWQVVKKMTKIAMLD